MTFPDLRYQKQRRSPDELLQHMKTFRLEPKISVGIWYFTPGGGRFHDAYIESSSVPERIEMAAEMARYGVKGIEAHYPLEANEENLPLYQKLEQEAGIKLTGIGPHIFYHKDFEFGSLSNPMPAPRQKAYDILVRNLKLVKEAGANVCGIWPGIDGYTQPFGHLYYDMWDRFEESVAAAMDEVPGVRVAIEPKPYEPAPNNIYRTSADGLIMANDVESRLKHPENRSLAGRGPRHGRHAAGDRPHPHGIRRYPLRLQPHRPAGAPGPYPLEQPAARQLRPGPEYRRGRVATGRGRPLCA